jgi:hypothetical protein
LVRQFSDDFQVDCLGPLFVRFHVEADALTFIEPAKARGLNGSDVNEHVLSAAFRRNEAKALRGIEKFDLSGRHYGFLLNTGYSAADTMSATLSKSRLFVRENVVVTPGRLHSWGDTTNPLICTVRRA